MTHRIGRLRRLDIAAVSVKVLPMGNVSCERGLGIELTVDTAVTTVPALLNVGVFVIVSVAGVSLELVTSSQ